jgi:hypothetical protein
VLLPDNPVEHLWTWLLDIGPTLSTGMGERPIECTDLVAWQMLSGVDLMPWESSLLRRASNEYLAEKSRARKPDCPAPYSGTESDIQSNRDRVAASVRAIFGGRKK